MKKLKVVCDMDEVLADLSLAILERVNKDFKLDFPIGYNKSYWWQDYGIKKRYFENLLNEEGFFLNLKPVDGAIETLTILNKEEYDIHILTCPQHNEFCYIEKVKWIKKYLPFINVATHFHTTGNKGMFAKENRVLIDDNPIYLNQFEENGGTSIAFNQGWNRDYDGYRAYDWNDVYSYIKALEPNGTSIDVDKFREYMGREDD